MFIDGFEELVHTSSGYKSKSDVEERSTDIEIGALRDPVGLRRMAKKHEALERATP
jgi:hypothetical protein